MTWEITLARPLLIMHALAGFSVLAVAVHLLLASVGLRSEANPRRRARASRYAWILAAVLLGAVLTGSLAYPAFRVAVRGAYLDSARPALTGLFEIKEHAGTLGLALGIGLWLHFRRSGGLGQTPTTRAHVTLVVLLALFAVFNVVVGLLLVMERSV